MIFYLIVLEQGHNNRALVALEHPKDQLQHKQAHYHLDLKVRLENSKKKEKKKKTRF